LYCNDGIKLCLRATVVANEPIVHAPDYTRGLWSIVKPKNSDRKAYLIVILSTIKHKFSAIAAKRV
jgi:hypothetical protein